MFKLNTLLKKIDKKGVSPLIAMVLVIALAVTIGAMVISWSVDFTKDKVDYVDDKSEVDKTCSLDVSIDFWEKPGNCKDICYNVSSGSYNNSIFFTLVNKGDEPVDGIVVTVMDVNGNSHTSELNGTNLTTVFPLKKAGMYKFNITLPDNVDASSLELVKIYPQIRKGKTVTVCTNAPLTEEQVMKCPYICYP